MIPRCPRCDSAACEPCDAVVEASGEKFTATHRCANPDKPNCPCSAEPFRFTPGTREDTGRAAA